MNNLLPIRNGLTVPARNLKIVKMITNSTELLTPFDNCLGYTTLQLSIRTTYPLTLNIDCSDDHKNNTNTSHTTPYSFDLGANVYKYLSIPIKGHLVRLRADMTAGNPDPLADSLVIKAQYSMSPHYILV